MGQLISHLLASVSVGVGVGWIMALGAALTYRLALSSHSFSLLLLTIVMGSLKKLLLLLLSSRSS